MLRIVAASSSLSGHGVRLGADGATTGRVWLTVMTNDHALVARLDRG